MKLQKKYIFLLGRPGCGKSAVYNKLIDRLKEENLAEDFPRVDDFPKLWAKFQADDEREKNNEPRLYSRKTEDGGYKVTNNDMWNELLKEVNEDIKKMEQENRVVFVEFSRDSYKTAFKNFDEDVLNKAVAIYIDAPFEVCWERNVARHQKAVKAGADDHLVSKEEMEKTYLHDDGKELPGNVPLPVEIVDNSKDDLSYLDSQIEKIVQLLKEKYSN